MIRLFKRKRGISIIGAIFTLIILGIFGAAIVTLVSTENEARRIQLTNDWIFYNVQAGLEYALREVDVGGYPIVTDKPFGKGSFTTSIVYDEVSTRRITATGTVAGVQQSHQITYDYFGADCFSEDHTGIAMGGAGLTELTGITVRKVCNEGVNIDKIYFSWGADGGEKVTSITINDNLVWEDPSGIPSGSTADIQDTLLTGTAAYPVSFIRFTGNMSGKTLTIKYIMTDTSTETISFPIP